MRRSILWFIFCLCLADIGWSFVYSGSTFLLDNGRNVTNASLGQSYSGVVASGDEDIFYFQVAKQVQYGETIRLQVSSPNATEDTPLLFVARLTRGVLSWTVPLVTFEGEKYHHISSTLCPALNMNLKNKTDMNFFIDVSTAHKKGLPYNFIAYKVPDFELGLEDERLVNANPAEPVYYQYRFPSHKEHVLVTVTSNSTVCATVLIQNSKCPSFLEGGRDYAGFFATVTTQASITVNKHDVPGGKFYVAVLVHDTDMECLKHKGEINPFAPTYNANDDEVRSQGSLDKYFPASDVTGNRRTKTVKIVVTALPAYDDYLIPVMMPLVIFGGFYLIALLSLILTWCLAENGGRSFIAYLFPAKVHSPPDTEDGPECESLLQNPVGSRNNSSIYGSQDSSRENLISDPKSVENGHPVTASTSEDGNVEAHPRYNTHLNADEEDLNEYDWLEDVDNHKDVYLFKRKLYVADVSKKSYKKLSKKFNFYFWNVVTIAVFYALPVVQLVLTYQRVVNTSGDQDICYYNFKCARPYGYLSAFNNIYSNCGYILLGILFTFLVLRRDRLWRLRYYKNPEREKMYGIPKHFGILYAMGYALTMEGVMSACYHVCPNYSNFQFDTAFMYMIGLLGCLRLYQARHHDVFLNAHYAYTGFAAVIFTSVIGVIFRSWQFWVIFLIMHCSATLYLSAQIYYLGRIKTAIYLHLFTQKKYWCSRPIYMDRFILLLIVNIVNWALSINGLIHIPPDFATYLLGIIIVNGLLYTGFYVIMKLRNGEKIRPVSFLFVVLSLAGWGVSISFFIKGLTNWQLSPAQSREGNRDCIMFDFFDDHDVWHLLSSMSLFFSFMSVMTVDDDLDKKLRSEISVF